MHVTVTAKLNKLRLCMKCRPTQEIFSDTKETQLQACSVQSLIDKTQLNIKHKLKLSLL